MQYNWIPHTQNRNCSVDLTIGFARSDCLCTIFFGFFLLLSTPNPEKSPSLNLAMEFVIA